MSSINEDVKVIDNYLPKELFDQFSDLTSSDEFTWGYDANAVDDGDNFPQLVHVFFCADSYQPSSPWYDDLIDILDFCNVNAVGRIKLNGNFKESTIRPKPFHRDFHYDDPKDIKSNLNIMILHLNTNDGFTIIKDTDDEIYRIKSVANRAIFFPNSYEHTGTSCTDISLRKVFNMVYA
jgi:hypothetical protein